jgi:FAD/FMN-containing dehydrogenase
MALASSETPATGGELLSGLSALLDPAGLMTDPALLARHAADWTGKDRCLPVAVARPRSTQEVAAVLAYCHAHAWPVAVQGGLTGLSGGATPRPGELALSLERLCGVEHLDTTSAFMVVGAGTSLAAVQDAAAEQRLTFPLDLASRGTCTVGGNIATNAGGNRVLRYGMTRNLVLGLEAVLADGTVLSSLGGVLKDNAGYDLKQLFIGSEGTLGVVTRASLRLFPEPAERLSLLVALASFDALLALLGRFRAALGPRLTAFEAMWDSYMECALRVRKLARPFAQRHAFYALAEVESLNPQEDRRQVEVLVADAVSKGEATDAILANSLGEASRLWRIRECAGELLGALKPAGAHDISMPVHLMNEYARRVEARYRVELGGEGLCAFGHLGDGNLHLMSPLRSADDAQALDAIVYGLLPPGGSVSAEHGVGVSKKQWLGVSRSEAEIAVMRSLKQHLDSRGILNPGRVI